MKHKPDIYKSKEERSPLADFIISRRQELGINQLELSDRSGVSSGTIASIEGGYSDSPKASTLHKLASGLLVSYEELDCILRGVPYQPSGYNKDPLREFEFFLKNHPKLPSDVSEMLINIVQMALKKYD